MNTIRSTLIIDDNPDDQYLTERALIRAGAINEEENPVFMADNGQEALDFLANYDSNKAKYGDKYPPLLIFLDINMPVMDGFEFLDAYQVLDKKYDDDAVIIMMLTSSESAKDMDKALTYTNVKDYVTKPLSKAKINDIVAKCLQKSL